VFFFFYRFSFLFLFFPRLSARVTTPWFLTGGFVSPSSLCQMPKNIFFPQRVCPLLPPPPPGSPVSSKEIMALFSPFFSRISPPFSFRLPVICSLFFPFPGVCQNFFSPSSPPALQLWFPFSPPFFFRPPTLDKSPAFPLFFFLQAASFLLSALGPVHVVSANPKSISILFPLLPSPPDTFDIFFPFLLVFFFWCFYFLNSPSPPLFFFSLQSAVAFFWHVLFSSLLGLKACFFFFLCFSPSFSFLLFGTHP